MTPTNWPAPLTGAACDCEAEEAGALEAGALEDMLPAGALEDMLPAGALEDMLPAGALEDMLPAGAELAADVAADTAADGEEATGAAAGPELELLADDEEPATGVLLEPQAARASAREAPTVATNTLDLNILSPVGLLRRTSRSG